MYKKVLFLDYLSMDSNIHVGSHKYAGLFRKSGYEVFSLSQFINIYRFLRRNSEDRELIRAWHRKVQITKEGVYFYTPFCFFPYLNFPGLDSLRVAHNCLKFCYPDLRKILEDRDFINIDLLFINNIRLISILNFVKPKVIIFRISDRIEGFKNLPVTVSILKNEVIKISHLVFATSKNLQQEASRVNKNTFYLPNGVDEEFIKQPNEKYPYPDEYKNIKFPIVVYIGAVSDWFDYELYEYGLAKIKDASFVIIGPVLGVNYRKNLIKIQQYSKIYENFHYLGPKPHTGLKKYLAHANIGIIPFKIDPLTNEINPVKFFEYAAFGLPIIASPMAELQNYKEHVLFYRNKREYISLLSNHVDKKQFLSQKLIEFTRTNTWESRFEFMLSQIEKIKK